MVINYYSSYRDVKGLEVYCSIPGGREYVPFIHFHLQTNGEKKEGMPVVKDKIITKQINGTIGRVSRTGKSLEVTPFSGLL